MTEYPDAESKFKSCKKTIRYQLDRVTDQIITENSLWDEYSRKRRFELLSHSALGASMILLLSSILYGIGVIIRWVMAGK